MLNIIILFIGIGILWIGSDWFIKGGRILAASIGISPLIIGLTLGAIGTSMPELIVSSMASLVGKSNISLGNVVGSNMANIGFALGIGAMILPVPVEKDVIKYDYWVLLFACIMLYLFTMNNFLSRPEGMLLILMLMAYVVLLLSRHYGSKMNQAERKSGDSPVKSILIFISGITALIVGARIIVNSASELASAWGLSDTVIGITVVAVGTSLPEIAVVVAGSIKKQSEISIGTIIGSNIINIFLVAGAAAIITPVKFKPEETMIQAPAVILLTILLLPIVLDGKIRRFEGLALFLLYSGYIYVVM